MPAHFQRSRQGKFSVQLVLLNQSVDDKTLPLLSALNSDLSDLTIQNCDISDECTGQNTCPVQKTAGLAITGMPPT